MPTAADGGEWQGETSRSGSVIESREDRHCGIAQPTQIFRAVSDVESLGWKALDLPPKVLCDPVTGLPGLAIRFESATSQESAVINERESECRKSGMS